MTTKENTIKEIQTRQELKIRRLKARQEAREKDGLYHPNSIEGEDYIICPITNVRFTKIKKGHITGTLGITEDEYYELFPELKGKVANRLKKRISEGQKTKMAFYDDGSPVLDKDGKHLTGDQWGRLKARQKLNEIDPETGMRGYDKLGEKTRNSHLSKVDENGLNGYQRIAKEAIHKGNKTKAEKYGHRDAKDISDFDRYSNIIDYLTYKCDTNLYTNGVAIKTRRDGGDNAQQIDHIYSVKDAFKNGISPLCVAMPENTQIITAKQNEDKNDSSHISIDELFLKTSYTSKKSNLEFECWLIVADEAKQNDLYNSGLRDLQRMSELLSELDPKYFKSTIEFIEYMVNKSNY